MIRYITILKSNLEKKRMRLGYKYQIRSETRNIFTTDRINYANLEASCLSRNFSCMLESAYNRLKHGIYIACEERNKVKIFDL